MSPPKDENRERVVRFLAQVIESAWHNAEMAAAFLASLGLKPKKDKPGYLPAEFLLELGAILHLARWERAGIHRLIDPNLPSARDALHQLLVRAADVPDSFSFDVNLTTGHLSHQVFRLWLMRCARSSVHELGVDVLISGANSDLILNALAEFIWNHRQLGKG